MASTAVVLVVVVLILGGGIAVYYLASGNLSNIVPTTQPTSTSSSNAVIESTSTMSVSLSTFLATSTSTLTQTFTSLGRTFYVPSNYSTIDAAITASEPGDTIKVAPGNYSAFTVDRAVTVEATSSGTSVEGIAVTASGATVKGFVVHPAISFSSPDYAQESCAAILVEGSNDLIENNLITNPPSTACSNDYTFNGRMFGIFISSSYRQGPDGIGITYNVVTSMFGGIADDQGYQTNIYGNIINGSSEAGIWLFNSRGDQIHLNQIGVGAFGVWLDSGSTSNVVVSNNFVNGSSARDDGSGNSWSVNGKGNYWSSWTSPDNDHDGIVDLPYPIPGSARSSDQYPLVNPVALPVAY